MWLARTVAVQRRASNCGLRIADCGFPSILNPKSEIRNPASGFTLVEVLVVIAVIAILLTMLFAGVPAALRSSKVRTSQVLVSQVALAVGIYYDARGAYPRGSNFGCRTLVGELGPLLKVRDASFIDTDNDNKGDTVVDPWGRPLIYTRYVSNAPDQLPGQSNGEGGIQPLFNPKTFDLFSAGAYADKVVGGTTGIDYQKNALANDGLKYTHDGEKLLGKGGRPTGEVNRYIGNW